MKEKNPLEKEKQTLNSYIKYSALGFQMIGIIGIFAFIGFKLDDHFNNKTPYITAGLSLFGVGIAMYIVIRGLKQNN